MNVELYYFSATGNSLHVARELNKRLRGSKMIPVISKPDSEAPRSTGRKDCGRSMVERNKRKKTDKARATVERGPGSSSLFRTSRRRYIFA
jgi:flavodoxin